MDGINKGAIVDKINAIEVEKIKNDIVRAIGEPNTKQFEKILALNNVVSDIENLMIMNNQKLTQKAIVANLMSMKRYRMKPVIDCDPDRQCVYVDAKESDDGDWVKLKDVEKFLILITDGMEKTAKDGFATCICGIMSDNNKSWFCPAHGYKKL